MADTIQDVGVKRIMGARWLLGGMRRLGKATSSLEVFLDRKLAPGSHLKVRGRCLPIEAYDFDRGWRTLEHSDWTLDVSLCQVSITPTGFFFSHIVNSGPTQFVWSIFLGGRPLPMKVRSKAQAFDDYLAEAAATDHRKRGLEEVAVEEGHQKIKQNGRSQRS